MSYTPTLEDLNEITSPAASQVATPNTQASAGYVPSLADLKELTDSKDINPAQQQSNTPFFQQFGLPSNFKIPVNMMTGGLLPANTDNAFTNFASGTVKGLMDVGNGIGDLVDKGADKLLGTNLSQKDVAANQALDKAYSQQFQGSPAATAGLVFGNVAPMIGGGEFAELGKGSQLATQGLAKLTQKFPGLSKIISSPEAADTAGMIGKNILFGAGAGAAGYDPNGTSDPLKNAAIGGLIGGAVSGIGVPLANLAANYLPPSKLVANAFGKGIDPEQLQKSLDITQGTNTPIGDVLQDPTLKTFYENVLQKVPFSGVDNQLKTVANQVTNKGQDLMNSLIGDTDAGDIGKVLQQSLVDKLKGLQSEKRDLFNMPNQLADDAGLKITPNNLAQKAQDTLNTINNSKTLFNETDPGLISDLQNYAKYGSDDYADSLKSSGIFRGKLGQKASNAFQNNQDFEYGVYKDLKDAYDQDIGEGVDSLDNPEVKNSIDEARQFYKDNIVPFEDPSILKFTKEGGDPDTLLSTFIKSGKTNDRGNLLASLINKLPDEQKLLPAYGWFSKALDEDGNLNPNKFLSIYKQLGDKQKAALIPDDNIRQQFADYANLVGRNSEALNAMYNPKTGNRLQDWKTIATVIAAKMSALASGGGLTAARMAAKAMTSPAFRQKVAQQILNPTSVNVANGAMQGGLIGGGNQLIDSMRSG